MAKPPIDTGLDAEDLIENKSAQLASLLVSMYGNGFECFRRLGARHQENLIWLAADLACDIRDAAAGEVCHG
jgi:hypothetical protein